MDEEVDVRLNDGVFISRPKPTSARISMILWGEQGSGKTTLAATAPGDKLFMLFDPNGTSTILGRSDVYEMDLTGVSLTTINTELKKPDPFGMGKRLSTMPNIKTIVIDSLTRLWDDAIEAAVAVAKSTAELPGIPGYSARNTFIKRAVSSLMRLASKLDMHIIFILHNGNPELNLQGQVSNNPPILSARLLQPLAISFSEIWYLESDAKDGHKIYLRANKARKFMKTRMFDTSETSELVWRFNPQSMKGDGISTWFDKWSNNAGRQLAVPK